MLSLVTIPCLKDNYAFLVHDAASGATALIDVPEAAPILAELDARGWALSHVLLTHHHWDHVDGLPGLGLGADVTVIGGRRMRTGCHRWGWPWPKVTASVSEGPRSK